MVELADTPVLETGALEAWGFEALPGYQTFPSMRLVIAGGRDYTLTRADYVSLDALAVKLGVAEVVSGGAKGADAGGEDWAKSRGFPVRLFPAQWKRYGKRAGPIRNREMAEYADAVALFPGGSGTESMRREARRSGLPVYRRNSSFAA